MARKALKNEKNISYDEQKKRYYVCFDYGKDESGKRRKQYKTYETKEEAIKARNRFQNDRINGTLIQPSKMTVQDYLTQYIENMKPSSEKTTIYGYEQILKNHIYPALEMSAAGTETGAGSGVLYRKDERGKAQPEHPAEAPRPAQGGV